MMPVGYVASRWEPETDEDYDEALAELTGRWTEWVAGHDVGDSEIPEVLLHYKWRFLDGHLTRWSRGDLEEIYLELYPAKVVADPGDSDEILGKGRAFLTFLSDVDLLDAASEPVELLVAHLERIGSRFRTYMADRSRYSTGKRFTMAALAEGVALDDQAAVEAFMARFNSRPRAERELLMGLPRTTGAAAGSSGRVTPRGTPPRPSAKRRKRRR